MGSLLTVNDLLYILAFALFRTGLLLFIRAFGAVRVAVAGACVVTLVAAVMGYRWH
jgi:hypothetical protein